MLTARTTEQDKLRGLDLGADDYECLDRTIDAHIMNLRKKIEPNRLQPSFIVTVYGVGYKFSTEGDAS